MAIGSVTCGTCHAGASATSGGSNHDDGNVDVAHGTYPTNITKHGIGTGYGTCSTSSCHVSSYGTSYVTATWGAAASCAACHTGSGALSGTGSGPNTGSHNKHMAVAGAACNQCHTGASATSGGSFHTDGNIDVISGYTPDYPKHAINTGYTTCSAATCHNPVGTTGIATPVWGQPSTCASCHNGASAFSGTGSGPNTGSHNLHMALGYNCNSCHDGASTTSGGTGHYDGNIDVTVGYPASVARHGIGSGYATCTTACHGTPYSTSAGGTPSWGATPTGCGACHNGAGAFSGTGSGPNTATHNKHMALAGVNCGTCHAGATLTSGGSNHGTDPNINVAYGSYPASTPKHGIGSGYGTCSTSSCHVSSNGTAYITATWGATTG
jgi:predicted CxxxxCH...CXXCH cytochrome family protein